MDQIFHLMTYDDFNELKKNKSNENKFSLLSISYCRPLVIGNEHVYNCMTPQMMELTKIMTAHFYPDGKETFVFNGKRYAFDLSNKEGYRWNWEWWMFREIVEEKLGIRFHKNGLLIE